MAGGKGEKQDKNKREEHIQMQCDDANDDDGDDCGYSNDANDVDDNDGNDDGEGDGNAEDESDWGGHDDRNGG